MQQTNFEILSLDFYLSNNELKKRHDICKYTPQAHLFFPSESEIVDYDPKKLKKTLRRIFESKISDYLPHEKLFLKELEDEIIKYNEKYPKKKLIFPENYKESEKLRLHQATSYNVSNTIKLLLESIEWRKTFIPPILTNRVLEILNCGFVYVHGRDCHFRPIIVINVEYYKKNEDLYTYDEWLQATIYFMEYLVNNLLIPGQVENWDVISDFGSVNFFFLPSNVKKLMGILQSNWRCRLYVNYILNMSSIVRGLWKIVKAFLDEATVHKVQFIENSNKKNIFTYINEEQVEQKFGGKAPNIVPGMHTLFPPLFPSENFLLPGQVESEQGIVSEEKYKELYQSNKLAVVGDYFLKKWEKEEEEKKLALKLKIEKEEEEKKAKVLENQLSAKEIQKNLISSENDKKIFELNNINLKVENEVTISSKNHFSAIKGNVFKNSSSKASKFFKNKFIESTPPLIQKTPDIISCHKYNSVDERISEISEIDFKQRLESESPHSEKNYELDHEIDLSEDEKNLAKTCSIY
jgi:hypothetical protein